MATIDTSRIANEKQRHFARRLSSVEERVESLSETLRGFVKRLEVLEKASNIDVPKTRLDLSGYENEEDSVQMLREQLDQLGVKYHQAHKEKKLRELLNEALKSEGETDGETE